MAINGQLNESQAADDEYCIERIGRYQVSNGKESLISMNLSPIKKKWLQNEGDLIWSLTAFGYLHLLDLSCYLLNLFLFFMLFSFLLVSHKMFLLLLKQSFGRFNADDLSVPDSPK